MKTNITYAYLTALEQDILRQSQISPAFNLFHREKIKRFYQDNQLRLKIMNDTMQGLVKKYVLHDENDKPLTHDVDGQLQYKFIDEAAEKDYEVKAKMFMELTIDLHI